MIRIFVGYDSREVIAHHVCVQSIMETTSTPISITPLKLSNLESVFHRKPDADQLTEFSYTRFLVPYLCDYQGWAIFIDGDMLLREDIQKLWDLRDERYSIMVVKHKNTKGTHTFLGNTLKLFPRFNWSSVMLFNNAQCRALTPEYLHKVNRQDLHEFKFLDNDEQIGELDPKWNHLVGYDNPNPNAALVHWTLGAPCFEQYKNAEFAEEWFAMRDRVMTVKTPTPPSQYSQL